MGKCVRCFSLFPPQYMRELEGVAVDVTQCVFCQHGKDYVMIMKEDGSEEKYTKKQCIKDYKMFLKQLKETPNIAEKLAKNKVKIE
jgi:hypothetical protein